MIIGRIKELSDPILRSQYNIGQILILKSYNKGVYFDIEKDFCFYSSDIELITEVDEEIVNKARKRCEPLKQPPKKDPIVKRVLKRFKQRSKQGIETYGTTLQENNLTTLEWINEAQAEAMDFCLYLEKLKDKIKEYDRD